MRLVITSLDDRRVSKNLQRQGERATNLKRIAPSIYRTFQKYERALFTTQGASGPDGRWPALKPETVARKRKMGKRSKILQEEGDLLRSLTRKNDPDAVFRVEGNSMFMGTSRPYAKFHQDPGPNSRLKRRRPVVLSDPARKETKRKLADFILTGKRSG